MSINQEFKDFLASLEELKERQGKKSESEGRKHFENLIKQYFEFREEKMSKLSLRNIFSFPDVSEQMREVGKPYPDLLKKFEARMEENFEVPEGIENSELFPKDIRDQMDQIRKKTGN